MSIQNDNTLVTKGDLKELYTDKIAPYLGGGISYYYSDRTGEELKVGEYSISGSLPNSTSQDTKVNISTYSIFSGETKRADFLLDNNTIVIPEGMTVKLSSELYLTPGDSGKEVNIELRFRDYTNNIDLDYVTGTYFGAGYSRSGTWSTIYTAPAGGANIGLRCVYCSGTRSINSNSRIIVQEIGRIVDLIKYVDNNSSLEETPVGNIISYMGNSVPKHYLACDGTTYVIGSYPELEQFIIDEFGSINYFGGNGSTTWAVPDLRGEFLRGTGTNSHTNQGSGANVGEHQDATQIPDLYMTHNATIAPGVATPISNKDSSIGSTSTYRNLGYGTAATSTIDVNYTSRPTNTSVKYCIKYESTFHAFFSNAAYKVSVAASVAANGDYQYIFDSSDIIGDSSLVSGNSFIAPIDGWYIVGMDVTEKGNTATYTYLKKNNTPREFVVSSGSTHSLYLTKNDVITVWQNSTSSGHSNSGRISFCLLTSNYNPTIVSANSVYSENEQMIGYWKDGKPLYQKTINFGALPNAITKNVAHGISNLDYVTNIFCVASNSDGSIQATLPYLNPRSDTNDVSIKVNGNDIQIVSASDMSAFIKTFVTVQYTKTTDTASSLQIENSLLLNRPDLWEAGTEYHFGGGLYGQRFTGNTPDIATGDSRYVIQLAPVGTFTNNRIFDFGGNITAYNSTDGLCVHPIGSRSINGAVGSEYKGYHIDTGIYFTADGRLSLGIMCGEHHLTTANTYDVWVTYKK